MWTNICEATTLKGKRCKKQRKSDHFCKIHDPDYKKMECSICYSDIKKKITLDCDHSFCKECIFTWICKCKNNKLSCPLCRNCIKDNDIITNARSYGISKKLVFLLNTTIFSLNILTDIEYNTIKNFIYENEYLPKKFYLTMLVNLLSQDDLISEPIMKPIINKLIISQKMVKRMFFLQDGNSDNDEELYLINNNRIL